MTLQEYVQSLRDKSIAVIGIGVSNTPLIELLCAAGCQVTACDKRTPEQMGAEGERLASLGATLKLGESYLDDLNQDETFDELCFLANLDKKEKQQYTVTLLDQGEPRTYPARVFAEMVLSNTKDKKLKKNQQNNYIESLTARGDAAYTYNIQHHHGVDFESELNGIRIYFDARQTLDLYGKFKKQLELKETQFYTDEDQKKRGYGDDVLWVGQTFGLGAFRGWDGQQPTLVEPVKTRTQRIISYGPLRTIVEVIDKGWQAPSAISHQPSAIRRAVQQGCQRLSFLYGYHQCQGVRGV